MDLSFLKQLDTNVQDGDFSVDIKYNSVVRKFDEKNRMLQLYSDITYKAENFVWESTVPTVRIPYYDPSLGFLVDGVIFSSVGVYSRAPGIVPDIEEKNGKSSSNGLPKIDIVNVRNSTITIGYRRHAVKIIFNRGKERTVPIGIFLKALSGLPYSEILKNFAYKPQELCNAFPCSIPKGNVDLARAVTYGIESTEEPPIEACVDEVYRAINQLRDEENAPKYTVQWKLRRICGYFNNLHFKTLQKYESTLSVGNRAVGTYLDEDIRIPYFRVEKKTQERLSPTGGTYTEETEEEVVDEFFLPKGHYVTDADARELRRMDIHKIRVRTHRSFILQEKSPMLFRAKGYKLVDDIPEAEGHAGQIIDEELLQRLNQTKRNYLDVYIPGGRKVLHRSGEDVEVGDFYTILNCLFTFPYMAHSDTTQYEVSNRIVLDYDKQIRTEVEQTYAEIVSAISGSNELSNLLNALPPLPSNRLCQYLRDPKNKEVTQADLTNIMSRAISTSKASAGMRATPAAMMPVQLGQYGRFDSFHAPDSDKVGSVQQRTIFSRINEVTSEVEAPYEKVVHGRLTGEIVYISAGKEKNKYIVAWNDDLTTPTVLARYNGEITPVDREKVNYRDPSPFCDMSVSRMCIPFPGFSQPKRALMATKMNGQAIPVLFPERPLVSTGADTEVPGLYYTGRDILEECSIPVVEGRKLELVGHTWQKNLVEYRFIYGDEIATFSLPFTATDKESLYNYNLNMIGSDVYDVDDIIFYNHSCDIKEYEYWTRIEQGTMPLVKDFRRPSAALGVNLRFCFKTSGSVTVDDAMLINQRLVADRTVSTVQIYKYNYKLRQDEEFSEHNWCATLHGHVYPTQPVIKVQKFKRHGEETMTEHEVLSRHEGEVIYANKDNTTREAEVWVMTIHDAEVGDKMAGRYGDKAVIAKILPNEMMPYDPETGEVMDVVLTPLGMPSRMNYGRILEGALGAVMQLQGKHAICTPFYPGIKEEIVNAYNAAGLKPKRLFNPEYGKLTERPVMIGMLYIMKLEQMSNLKLFSVGYPTAVDPVFGQPVDSINQKKGQAIGEMESWALIAAGANKILDAFHSIYSDDEEARKTYFDALAENNDTEDEPWDESFMEFPTHSVNNNALVTQIVMRMFGCDIQPEGSNYVILPLKMSDIPIRISQDSFLNGNEMVGDSEWFTVPLSSEVVNPFWVMNFPLHLVLGVKSVKNLVRGKSYLNRSLMNDRENCIVSKSEIAEYETNAALTGVEAIIELIRNTTIDEAITRLKRKYSENSDTDFSDAEDSVKPLTGTVLSGNEQSEDELQYSELGDLSEVPMGVADVLRFLYRMRKDGRTLEDLIWKEMPIIPRKFRQSNLIGDREQEHSFQTQLKAICSSRATPQSIYDGLCAFIGYSSNRADDLISIRGYFFGKGSQAGQHGAVREDVLSTRVGFSGRVVIVPWDDPHISPFFVGLPWRVVMNELGPILAIRLNCRKEQIGHEIAGNTSVTSYAVNKIEVKQWQAIVESLGDFNTYLLGQYFFGANEDELCFIYNYLRSIVKRIVEGDVTNDGRIWYNGEYVCPEDLPDNVTIDCAMAMSGRQPTLHKKSIRAYFVKLVDGYCMRIHHMVCSGYNADFDGDTMWHVQLMGDTKNEACRTLFVLQDLISEKDGSYTLDISQDAALGLYCATTLRDNAFEFEGAPGEYYFFDDLDELRMQLEYGDLHYYDPVVFHNKGGNDAYYCSTAGRILVNGAVPGSFTLTPFTDPLGICAKVVGEEMKGSFKELLYDNIWAVTGIVAKGRSKSIQVGDVLLSIYRAYGERTSVMTAQALFEIGLIASDVYSVSMTLDDMSSPVDKEQFMHAPREAVAQLNSLYQLGLVTDESRKQASIHAWDSAKKAAQSAIIDSIDPRSNTYYMMYSGARGKPDQVMQSVGFIGNISKTNSTDIEYPILRGYGEGLSSLDLYQTAPSARLGVIATQAGTKDTGYATRQSVYMTSGLTVKEEDCGIEMRLVGVKYSSEDFLAEMPDGTRVPLYNLVGEFVDPDTEGFSDLSKYLNTSGYILTELILDKIVELSIESIKLFDKTVKLVYRIDSEWRQHAVEELYSYALPYTEDYKVTEKSVDWIEQHGLQTVVGFLEDEKENNQFLDREAYLPVSYDTMHYTAFVDGSPVEEESLYLRKVDENSPNIHYYKNLLSPEGHLTEKAVRYLTKKKVREIRFEDDTVVTIKYKLSNLFRNVITGRLSAGLPHLDDDKCITPATMEVIEDAQLEYIPVRTSLTCLSRKGVCSQCYGKSLSAGKFLEVGKNLGIAASQAMCEPLSQSTLNVGHSGGRRGKGIGLLSGLDYYKDKMLKGVMTSDAYDPALEKFSPISGIVSQNKKNKLVLQITNDSGESKKLMLDDVERMNVPDGAYVDVNDTIVSGLADLNRYNDTDVFTSALKTRYLLMEEYDKIFSSLGVSARNPEIMARAQTSICYAVGEGAPTKTKDTADESANPTGLYMLRVSKQAQVVCTYSGVASYGFENVANMLLMGMFTDSGLELNSSLGNLITGTPVGQTEATFIDKRGDGRFYKHHRSAMRESRDSLSSLDLSNDFTVMLGSAAGGGDANSEYIPELESVLLGQLFEQQGIGLPEQAGEPSTDERGFHSQYEENLRALNFDMGFVEDEVPEPMLEPEPEADDSPEPFGQEGEAVVVEPPEESAKKESVTFSFTDIEFVETPEDEEDEQRDTLPEGDKPNDFNPFDAKDLSGLNWDDK